MEEKAVEESTGIKFVCQLELTAPESVFKVAHVTLDLRRFDADLVSGGGKHSVSEPFTKSVYRVAERSACALSVAFRPEDGHHSLSAHRMARCGDKES